MLLKRLFTKGAFVMGALLTAAPACAKDIPLSSFTATIITEGLESPWDMVWGPDNRIWVTEREGKRVTAINPADGSKKTLAAIEGVHTGPQHEGILGMAVPTGLQKGGHVFIGHTYMDGEKEHSKIVRLTWDGEKLGQPVDILAGLPAGDDHNGGRLRFGPDGKLYYTIGEQGHNQFGNICKPILAQRLPSGAELEKRDYTAYAGKVLRFNPDGSIPADNPELDGVRSHIFTYGHRNPQGLVFVGNTLFSSEQGPSSDDEINILISGGNYGWPHVAGYQDDQAYAYANWSEAKNCAELSVTADANVIPQGVPVRKESDWKTPDNFQEPVKTMFTVPSGYNFANDNCEGNFSYLCWPTISPGSIAYYPENGAIAGWQNSLLVTGMKNGALYILPLHKDKKTVQGDMGKFFHTNNRYRMVLVSPDGKDIYIATDSKGAVMGMDRKVTTDLQNPGSVIKFTMKK